jgi:hypothetical protein
MAPIGVQLWLASMPGVALASSTTAPAPSPNNTQVVRSSKVQNARENLLRRSPGPREAAPLRIIASATVRP